MNDTTQTTPDNVQAARDSFNGRGLTEAQFQKAWALAALLHTEIHQSGTFREALTDFSHAFARGEKFDAMRGEAIVRDVYGGRYDQTLNATREALQKAQENLPVTALAQVLAAADSIIPMIKEGPTRPFYHAYDVAAVTLSRDLGITQAGAKSLMKEAYQAQYGQELYAVGKAVEKEVHTPVREAEIAARKQEPQRSQSMA
jgi:hypothetical protein